jgi:hypothetical protein
MFVLYGGEFSVMPHVIGCSIAHVGKGDRETFVEWGVEGL